MPDCAPISQLHRQVIIFLIDQSGSMNEQVLWCGVESSKAQAVCDVVNGALSELIARCNNYGQYKSYFDIAVFGYSGMGVKALLGEGRQNFYTPGDLAQSFKHTMEVVNVRTLPNGSTISTKNQKKIWIEPLAEGRTPMLGMFNHIYDTLLVALSNAKNRESFPPIVINITDGEINDGHNDQILEAAKRLRSLKTDDGNVILMNVHIANRECDGFIFSSSGCDCPVECNFGKILFEMSSEMPEFFEREIEQVVESKSPYRAFAYNASISDLVRMVNIGSSSTSLIL